MKPGPLPPKRSCKTLLKPELILSSSICESPKCTMHTGLTLALSSLSNTGSRYSGPSEGKYMRAGSLPTNSAKLSRTACSAASFLFSRSTAGSSASGSSSGAITSVTEGKRRCSPATLTPPEGKAVERAASSPITQKRNRTMPERLICPSRL